MPRLLPHRNHGIINMCCLYRALKFGREVWAEAKECHSLSGWPSEIRVHAGSHLLLPTTAEIRAIITYRPVSLASKHLGGKVACSRSLCCVTELSIYPALLCHSNCDAVRCVDAATDLCYGQGTGDWSRAGTKERKGPSLQAEGMNYVWGLGTLGASKWLWV